LGYGIALYNVQTQQALCLHFGLALLMHGLYKYTREKRPLSTDRVFVLRSHFWGNKESIEELEMVGVERSNLDGECPSGDIKHSGWTDWLVDVFLGS